MDILLGILAVAVGAAVCLAGLRLFFLLLPVWGWVIGFLVGAAGVSAIFGDGFLATTLGIVVGLIVAVVFAALAYLYWYVGVVMAAGGAGAVLGIALFAALGVNRDWLLFLIGLVVGVLFAVAATVIDYPTFLVVFNTAMAGAALAIAGVLLVFNQIDREEIGTGVLWRQLNDYWYLWLLWVVLTGVGIAVQFNMTRPASLPDDRWARAQPA